MRKSQVLIIVILVMLFLALLAWTLANYTTADLQSSSRLLDSERSLYIAEAGMEWAVKQLAADPAWRTAGTTHNFSGGQYTVVCRDPVGSEPGNVAFESNGYIPNAANARSQRQTKLFITLRDFLKAMQINGRFNWNTMAAASQIDGIIAAKEYNGDGDAVVNELGVDYKPLPTPPPVLPPDGAGDDRLILVDGAYPTIIMSGFEDEINASGRGEFWSAPKTAVISNIVTVLDPPVIGVPKSVLTLDAGIFTVPFNQWNNETLRNINKGTWQPANGQIIDLASAANTVRLVTTVDWQIGDKVTVVPAITNVTRVGQVYTVDFNCDVFDASQNNQVLKNLDNGAIPATWEFKDWGVIAFVNPKKLQVTVDVTVAVFDWAIGHKVAVARRFNASAASALYYLYYINGDALIDVRSNNLTLTRRHIIAQGDIAIKGEGNWTLTMAVNNANDTYPSLATEKGNIISLDVPGNPEAARRNRRTINGLIYSQDGSVTFNYLQCQAGLLGGNVTLMNRILIVYNAARMDPPNLSDPIPVFNNSSQINTWYEE